MMFKSRIYFPAHLDPAWSEQRLRGARGHSFTIAALDDNGDHRTMRRLALFARWPEPGRVKTRLSPALPTSLACQLYQAMLSDAQATCAAASVDERVLYWADAPADQDWSPGSGGFAVRDQRGSDLGRRLQCAFDEMLGAAADRAVVVGADCPDMDHSRIDEAFAVLDAHDVALGPSADGGYYLIGLRRPAPILFETVSWGTSDVLEQTLLRAREAGLTVRVLGVLADLDTPADLVAFVARRCATPGVTGLGTVATLGSL